MTPDLLRRVGEALFGERYQVALAAAVGKSGRTVRRWVAGDTQIPAGLSRDLARLLDGHCKTVAELRRELAAIEAATKSAQ